MTTPALRSAIENALGRRRLIWFGTRGDDAEALGGIDQFDGAVSMISRYRVRPSVESYALEDISGTRPDLDLYDIDQELRSEAVGELRSQLLRMTARPSAVVPYRPTSFLSGVLFARSDSDRCLGLGMFRGQQAAFEHKPWLELLVRRSGVPGVPWEYIADSEREVVKTRSPFGSLLLRPSRTTGGVGIVRVDSPLDVDSAWPDDEEAFVGVAPYLQGALPLNVGAVVWPDGGVTLHPGSVQLIGIEGCTERPFGFCGNDFAAFAMLEDGLIDSVEQSTRRIGSVLHDHGFRGAFGVDFLVHEGVPLFTEVNPRFQGSTHLSSRLSNEMGLPCIVVEHVASFLGLLPVGTTPRLVDLARSVPPSAHVVVHRIEGDRSGVDPYVATGVDPSTSSADLLVPDAVRALPGAPTARLICSGPITSTGYELLDRSGRR